MIYGQDATNKPLPQCVRVSVVDKDGKSSHGSGTYISPLLIATCDHVVVDRKENKCVVLFPSKERITAIVVETSKSPDIAILKLARAPRGVDPIRQAELIEGVPLSIQGYGKGDWLQQWGTLDDTKYADGYREIDGAAARSGDSGGPVTDSLGCYVGTLWGSAKGNTYFTPAKAVFKIAKIKEVKPVYPDFILRSSGE